MKHGEKEKSATQSNQNFRRSNLLRLCLGASFSPRKEPHYRTSSLGGFFISTVSLRYISPSLGNNKPSNLKSVDKLVFFDPTSYQPRPDRLNLSLSSFLFLKPIRDKKEVGLLIK